MTDLLIPGTLAQAFGALDGWSGPCIYDGRSVTLYGYTADWGWHCAWVGEDGCAALIEVHSLDDLDLDLARPEVQDRMSRVVGPWLRPEDDDAMAAAQDRHWSDTAALLPTWHRVYTHLARLILVARAVGLEPVAGERLELELRPPAWLTLGWMLYVGETWRFKLVPALAGITDPHEAASVVLAHLEADDD